MERIRYYSRNSRLWHTSLFISLALSLSVSTLVFSKVFIYSKSYYTFALKALLAKHRDQFCISHKRKCSLSVFWDIFWLKHSAELWCYQELHEVCLSLKHNVGSETKEKGEEDTECQYWLLKLSAFWFFYFLGWTSSCWEHEVLVRVDVNAEWSALLKLWPVLFTYLTKNVDACISTLKFDNSDMSNTFSLSPVCLISSSV